MNGMTVRALVQEKCKRDNLYGVMISVDYAILERHLLNQYLPEMVNRGTPFAFFFEKECDRDAFGLRVKDFVASYRGAFAYLVDSDGFVEDFGG